MGNRRNVAYDEFNPPLFLMLKNGTRTIELQLYDEKRRKISQGNAIRFHNNVDMCETILTKVTKLCVYRQYRIVYIRDIVI